MTILIEVDRYLRRTGMGPTMLGKLAVNDTTLVDKMRCGRQLQQRTADRVRAFMERHPDGVKMPRPIAMRRASSPIRKQLRDRVTPAAVALPPRVERTPCPNCGVRGDIGCEHGRAGVNW